MEWMGTAWKGRGPGLTRKFHVCVWIWHASHLQCCTLVGVSTPKNKSLHDCQDLLCRCLRPLRFPSHTKLQGSGSKIMCREELFKFSYRLSAHLSESPMGTSRAAQLIRSFPHFRRTGLTLAYHIFISLPTHYRYRDLFINWFPDDLLTHKFFFLR